MKLAILDLGTNTFHLLIIKLKKDGTTKKLFKSKTIVKLGKDTISKRRINDAAFRRGMDAIEHYAAIISKHKPDKLFALATSAIRSAENQGEFIRMAKEKTGIQIQVISGEKEAELIYYGVRQCVPLTAEKVLIMDIGGGSTEFIIANQDKIFWKKSFDIGASRLLQLINPSDPINETEINNLCNYLHAVLNPLFDESAKHTITKLVGSSGSFDSLAEMIGWKTKKKNVLKGVHYLDFNLDHYYALHELLLSSTINERKKIKGLVKLRVDMIVVASISVKFILEKIKIRKMTVSKYALKEGAVWKILNDGSI